MSYTNDSSTIRTILTQTGKQLLAQGKFAPSKFALSDSGIDYGMYNLNEPPTEADGAAILAIPCPVQTLFSTFYPLFSKLPGTLTTYTMILKGNTSTSFQLNSSKTYLIIPQTPSMTETYRMTINNTRYFSDRFSNTNMGRYTAVVLGLSFILNTVSDIARITAAYGSTFVISIQGLKSGAQLLLTFTYNPAGLPAQL